MILLACLIAAAQLSIDRTHENAPLGLPWVGALAINNLGSTTSLPTGQPRFLERPGHDILTHVNVSG